MAITITGIYPDTGVITGGTVHQITGTDMHLITSLTVNGTAVPAENRQALSTTLMRIVTPPFSATGLGDIVAGPGAVTLDDGFTVTAATASDEPLVDSLARKWKVDVNTGTLDSPTWTPVRAITNCQPTGEATMQDSSDYDSDGWGTTTKTMQTWGVTLTLGRKVGASSSTYDPGQEYIRARDDQFAGASVVEIRYYDRNGGPQAYQGLVSVGWAESGGNTPDLSTATATLSGQGKRHNIVNPAA